MSPPAERRRPCPARWRPPGPRPRSRASRDAGRAAASSAVGRGEHDPVVAVASAGGARPRRGAAVGGLGDGDHGHLDRRRAELAQARRRAPRPGPRARVTTTRLAEQRPGLEPVEVECRHPADDDGRRRRQRAWSASVAEGGPHGVLLGPGAPADGGRRRVGVEAPGQQPVDDLGQPARPPSGSRWCRRAGPPPPSRARRPWPGPRDR